MPPCVVSLSPQRFHSSLTFLIITYATMDAAGLGVGIIGLLAFFGSCLEMVKRWDSYKESVVEYRFRTCR
ncbi:hypothetical protein F5Y12DRAFT_232046 [Xylaria sp. FL1777]|nr:hypothetical protein F5Y12DRAFT_232046 [Xylaria sp. FL1777]